MPLRAVRTARAWNFGMQTGNKCRRIVEELAGEIAAGRYRAPSAFPSAEQIVRRFKVAYLTAVKALDELKRRGLVYSVVGAGTYVTRTAGRPVGLVVPAWPGSDFFPSLCHAVSAVCQRASRPLLYADTSAESGEGLGERVVSIAKSLVAERAGGALFHPIDFCEGAGKANREVLDVFREAGVPVVLLDCDISNPPDESGYDVVGIDNVAAGWRLGEHVISRGARKILFASIFAAVSSNAQSRLAGLRDAVAAKRGARLAAFDVPPDESCAAALTEAIRREKPDAVVCSSDKVAAEALRAIEGLGLRVPEDMLVAGVNDGEIARVVSPRLTTIHQPCADIARVAFETLERRRKDPDAPPMRVFLPAPLVERESTGARAGVVSSGLKSVPFNSFH